MHKGLNIGTEPAQSGGLFYPYRIDNYFKIVLGVKGYDRYQDDTAILARTKKEAHFFIEQAEKMYAELGITLNRKKTRI